jgi:predicted nuclease of predicted toxin-antitoxin system
MEFLANENFPFPSITLLRKEGFSVYSIAENSPGIADAEVMRLALENKFAILTLDRDYGELIFRHAFPDPPTVIYFRDKGADPEFAAEALLNSLREDISLFNDCFTVISHDKIRQRRYK